MSTPIALPRELGQSAYARANPLARLAPAAALGLLNVFTLDPVTPLLTLLVVACAVPFMGLSWQSVARVSWPLAAAAVTLVFVNTLADPAPGIGWEDARAGGVTAVRLLAIALPGVLALATIDPVDLTDALVQQLRVPARFGYGALAASRLFPLLTEDWRSQGMAARARGVSARGVVGRVRNLFRRVLLLLVAALRRATRLAVALDARGFAQADRSRSRPSAWTASDAAWCIGGLLAALAVVAVSVLSGYWRLIWTP
ncbi:MAG TPA: energy-coupling factor transporter transmembrane component T [Actinomycetes bacterium]|nr:energy-coupling factor transporter transmembrane component T [Actinomycetes bacterium]